MNIEEENEYEYEQYEYDEIKNKNFNKYAIDLFYSKQLENILDLHDYLRDNFPCFFNRSEYFVSFIIDYIFNSNSIKCNTITEIFIIEYFEEIDTTLQIVNNYLRNFKVQVSKQTWMYFCYKLYNLNNKCYQLQLY
jgi:hypothetical protein